jgi:hypothetical protein
MNTSSDEQIAIVSMSRGEQVPENASRRKQRLRIPPSPDGRKEVGRLPTRLLPTAAFLAAFLAAGAYFIPIRAGERLPGGFTPIRDDSLAARYLPGFSCPPEFGPIQAVFYRAAREANGLVRIAYHPVWARESNSAPGLGPFLSRILYTGGLSLHGLYYGKGDIECIGLTIDPSSGAVIEIAYETAEGYSSSKYGVRHKRMVAKGVFPPRPLFRVVSWNHLFALVDVAPSFSDSPGTARVLSYFSPALWSDYSMSKGRETLIKKDRAHFSWELGTAP